MKISAKMVKIRNIAILGAAGRDYHNFLVKYKNDNRHSVKFFTASQIPGIEERKFPKELAGKLYKKDIPIYPEEKLPELIRKHKIDEVVFAYSDLRHEEIMHRASIALSCGANFVLLGMNDTAIKSRKKVVSVCAVRTGSGKSPTSRKIADILRKLKVKIAVVRHPMPYGDLRKQKCQRFAEYADFEKHECTIEEREEYEPWIEKGIPIYAGVDYEEILRKAEKEADVIIWDGGNNDIPFYVPDLQIVVADPHRAGHEMLYHPGETNFRMADIIVISKVNTAKKQGIKIVKRNAMKFNKGAKIVEGFLDLKVSEPKVLKGKKALVVEDGPTLTHGEMEYGAGFIFAKKAGAKIIRPERYAVGSIKKTYEKYRQVHNVLPAMGYGEKQIHELESTINNAKCDVVVDGTPVKLSRLIRINKPIVDVDYVLKEKGYLLEKSLRKLVGR